MSVGFWDQIVNFLWFSIGVELWFFLSEVGGVRLSVFGLEDVDLLWSSVWVVELHQTFD